MDILEMHNILNNIYNKAEELNKKINDLHYKTSLQSYNNHFISINNNYYKQKYYMPVISVENKGDICFNINSIEFEFYVTKSQMTNIDLETLIRNYKKELNIYEYKDCTIDIYRIGDNKYDVLNKIDNSFDNKFGISIDCSSLSDSEIIQHFNIICSLLNKNF
ncbi:MAG: DUF3201 domain-containing protein [Ruminococcus sp.]|nr:DUF3201 domain-containing protein [Ruminococcus sp.]